MGGGGGGSASKGASNVQKDSLQCIFITDCAETRYRELNKLSQGEVLVLCFLCWNCLSGHIPSAISSDCNEEGQPTVTQSPYVRKYEKLSDQKCVCSVHPHFYFKIECFLHSWLLTYVIWPTKTEQCDLKHCKRISFDILATLSEEIALIYETYSKIFRCIFCNFLSQIYRRKFHKEL